MKSTFLIAAMTIIFSQVSYAIDFTSTLTVTAVYKNGRTAEVDCNNGIVNVSNIDSILFSFQEPYGTHVLECLEGSSDASQLVSKCTTGDVVKPVSGPEGWQEFSNSSGYLWTQNYPASKIPTKYNFKLAMKMALAAARTVYRCQFSTVGSSNVVIAPPTVTPPASGVYPYDCPSQFSPEPAVGTPCSKLQGGSTDFFPNATLYAKQHGINQTQTAASCAANEPQGNVNCWTDIEKATYINCLGTYNDTPEEMIIGGGQINMSIGLLYNGQPMYMWYRDNNPAICSKYVPSPNSQQSIQPIPAQLQIPPPAPVVTAPAPRQPAQISGPRPRLPINRSHR